MTTLLHVSASPRGIHSDSLRIAHEVLAAHREHHLDNVVDTFDLFDGTLPAFGNDFQSTYFLDWLNLIGVTDVAEIRLQPTIYSPTYEADGRQAIQRARSLGAQMRGHGA